MATECEPQIQKIHRSDDPNWMTRQRLRPRTKGGAFVLSKIKARLSARVT